MNYTAKKQLNKLYSWRAQCILDAAMYRDAQHNCAAAGHMRDAEKYELRANGAAVAATRAECDIHNILTGKTIIV